MKQITTKMKLLVLAFAAFFGVTAFNSIYATSTVKAAYPYPLLQPDTKTPATGKEDFFTIIIPSSGYITIQTPNKFSQITLMDAGNVEIDSTYLDNDNDFKVTFPAQKGTYYLSVSSSSSLYVQYSFSGISTLKSGTNFSVYPASSDQNYLYQFKPNKNGYVTFTALTDSGHITLLDSNKKALTKRLSVYNSSTIGNERVTYAVKKNTIYYVKLSCSDKTTFRYVLTSLSSKGGSKKSKATSLKSGKAIKGLLIAGNKNACWYKFKLTKNKKIKLIITGKCVDDFKIDVLDSSGDSVFYAPYTLTGRNISKTINPYQKFNKGTYYIKVSKKTSYSTGYFSVKFK